MLWGGQVLLKCRFQFTAKLLVCVELCHELRLIEERSQYARSWEPTYQLQCNLNRTKLRCKLSLGRVYVK